MGDIPVKEEQSGPSEIQSNTPPEDTLNSPYKT